MSGTIDWQLRALMQDEVTIAPRTGVDAYGMPVYGVATVYPCRVTEAPIQIRTASGEVTVSTAQVVLGQVANVAPHDQITLPDGTTPRILRLSTYHNENGPAFTKIWT